MGPVLDPEGNVPGGSAGERGKSAWGMLRNQWIAEEECVTGSVDHGELPVLRAG